MQTVLFLSLRMKYPISFSLAGNPYILSQHRVANSEMSWTMKPEKQGWKGREVAPSLPAMGVGIAVSSPRGVRCRALENLDFGSILSLQPFDTIGWRQEGHLACKKNLSGWVLEQGADLHMA